MKTSLTRVNDIALALYPRMGRMASARKITIGSKFGPKINVIAGKF